MSRWHYFLCYPLPLWSLLATAAALLWLSLSPPHVCCRPGKKEKGRKEQRERDRERAVVKCLDRNRLGPSFSFVFVFLFSLLCSLGNKIQQ